jgi:hypothetical protein
VYYHPTGKTSHISTRAKGLFITGEGAEAQRRMIVTSVPPPTDRRDSIMTRDMKNNIVRVNKMEDFVTASVDKPNEPT